MSRASRRPLPGLLAVAVASGTIHLIATAPSAAVPGPGSPPSQFNYLRSTDAGDSFTRLGLADASVEAGLTTAEAYGGAVHAVYDDVDPHPRRLFHRRSTNGGRDFAPSQRLDKPQFGAALEVGDSGEADVVADRRAVHAVWEDDLVLRSPFTIPGNNDVQGVRIKNDVTLSDGRTFPAEQPGGDPENDADNTVIPGGTAFPAGSVDPRADNAFFKLGVATVRRADREVNRDEIYYTSSPDGADFPVAVNLTNSPDVHNRDPDVDAAGANVVIAYEGTVTTVRADDERDDVLFARSADGGGTWRQLNVNLTPDDPGDPSDDFADQTEPAVALGADSITVALRNRADDDSPWLSAYVHSKDLGETFSKPTLLPGRVEVTEEDSTPAVLALGHVVNVVNCRNNDPDGDSRTGDESFRLLLWASSDGGAGFGDPVVLDRGPGECKKPRLDGAGPQRQLVYERDIVNQSDVFLLRSSDRGATWGGSRNLSADPRGSSDPTISIDPTDPQAVYVTWTNQTDFLFGLKYGQDLPLEEGGMRSFGNEDVIRHTGGVYEMVIDGSDVGLRNFRIDGLARLSETEFLLSFTESGTIPGAGHIDDSDIVAFAATKLGDHTTGIFRLWFDGSDIGLTRSGEDVDAVELRNGDLYLSTYGNFVAGTVVGGDEDLFVCRGVVPGPSTRCASLAVPFDGSRIGLGDSGEDVDAFAFDTVDPTPFLNDKGEEEVSETRALFSFSGRWATSTAAGGESDLGECIFPAANRTEGEVSYDLPDCGGVVPLTAPFLGSIHGLEHDIVALELDF